MPIATPRSLRQLFRPLLPLALAGMTGACASIVSNTDSTTYIQTEPENARCELHGQDFKRVLNTPASLALPAKAAPLTVACVADGYRITTETLDTKIDGWIFGNILFGGLIGVAVDAARGSGQKFPPQFTVILEPERFANSAARDAFYDKRRDDAAERWHKAIGELQSQCGGDGGAAPAAANDCARRLAEAAEKRDKELAAIERRRQTAVTAERRE